VLALALSECADGELLSGGFGGKITFLFDQMVCADGEIFGTGYKGGFSFSGNFKFGKKNRKIPMIIKVKFCR
jgi:hypothetical protein